MKTDIKVPEAGESITQVELARWLVEDGSFVEKDQEIAEIDSDKATLTINAEESGKIKIKENEGSTVKPGQVIGQIDTSVKGRKEEENKKEKEKSEDGRGREVTFSPQAKKLLDQLDIDPPPLSRPDSKRIRKKDVLAAIASKPTGSGERKVERIRMSTLRKKVAERLVSVRNQTAMLTTFNEADMTAVIDLRKRYKEAFSEKYGFKLGFMSFFVKAVTVSIPYFPQVNGYIDDDHIVVPEYADVGIAVSTPRGLMVPVIRGADDMPLVELERKINEMAEKARNNKISIEELSGGTISITNGGVFGSMLSTPILNPPQSAILGMHNIIERPVAIGGKVVIRPMMYLALSYDHRVIDGKESVGFLVKVKELIENPARMLTGGRDPLKSLIGLDDKD